VKWTIQFKLVSIFSAIVFVGLSTLLIISYNVAEQNMHRLIHDNMLDVKKNLDIAINQYFLVRNKRISEASLDAEKNRLAREVGSVVDGSLAFYSPDGKPLSSTARAMPADALDLNAAMNNQIAYKTSIKNKRVVVTLSFPLETGGSILGIVRYQKEYTHLYLRNLRFQETIKGFAAAIFVFITIASAIMARALTQPIRQLTRRSAEVAQGNLNVVIDPSTRDEIGELAVSFKVMMDRIRAQIDVIERERDEVRYVQVRSKAFFDNVTHELKTPITTILGYAQIVKDNGFNDPVFFNKGLEHIIKESNRLNRLVVDILELSTAAPPEYEYRMDIVDLADVVREACEDMLVKGAKYNISINYELQDMLIMQGDRDKLKEVLLNLLDNSIKYGHVDSVITVTACRVAGEYILSVVDRGEGIAPEALEHVFEPFYRSDDAVRNEKGSSGLGLSIVQSIVKQHGGTISMNSRLKEGSTVTVRFPEVRHE